VSLAYLLAENLRCWRKVELDLDPGLNLIWGSNGSGKSSLLEAAFLLGRGRSFRTHTSERVIAHGADRLIVFGRTCEPADSRRVAGAQDGRGATMDTAAAPGFVHQIGIEVARDGGTRARIDGRNAESLAELPGALPVQALDPDIHKLIEQGPERRRRWLDWAVFHVEPSFGPAWTRYMRGLRQRNAALKAGDASASAWDAELASLGEQLGSARLALLDRLQAVWGPTVACFTGLEPTLSLARGWPQETDLATALREAGERDRLRGTTTVGPHRADVQVRVKGRAAREVLSRGQQKLAASAMVVAQLKLLKDEIGLRPLLLLDDPAAELDEAHLQTYVREIGALECQMIVTSLRAEVSVFGSPNRVFHVEQGALVGV
jgi:DNA replication and repair protein RecF